MRTARSILPSFVAMLLFAGLVNACASSAGETCRQPSDCESGLLCCGTGAVVTGGQRGTCQAACTVTVVDAGTDAGQDSGVDAGQDAGQDSGADADVDASDVDASDVDASDVDASDDAG